MSNNPAYVNLSLGSGGDGTIGNPYGTWELAMAGEARSLTGLGEVIIYIQGTQVSTAASSPLFTAAAGWSNPSSSNYLHLKAWPGHEGDGTFANTPGWQGDVNGDGATLGAQLRYLRMTGLKVHNTSNNGNEAGCLFADTDPGGHVITNCLFKAPTQSIAPGILGTFVNCLFVSTLTNGNGTNYNGTGWSNKFINCSFIQLASGGMASRNANDTDCTFINCVSYGGWTGEYGGLSQNSGNAYSNSKNDAGQLTAPSKLATGYVQLVSNPFDGGLVEPYRPTNGGALHAGSSTGTPTPPTTDALGATRGATPYIGWLEASSASVISASGIVTEQAFGTAKTQHGVVATGVATALIFGTSKLATAVALSGIAGIEAFGGPTVSAVTSTLTDTLKDETGAAVLSTQIDYSLSTTWNGNEVTSGSVTSNGSGVYAITIGTAAGAVRYMRYKAHSGDTHHGLKKLTSV